MSRTTLVHLLLASSLWLLPLAGRAAPDVGSGPTLVATTREANSASRECLTQTLQRIGWQFDAGQVDAGSSAKLEVRPGSPCERGGLAESVAAGDLRLTLPAAAVSDSEVAAQLRLLLDHPATHCAYAMQLGEANRRAIDRLVANPDFRFSGLQLGWIGFGRGGAHRDGWRRADVLGRAFEPLDGNSNAIEAFYTGSIRAECGVGRQVAQYAAQAELYGAAFDTAFAPGELVIGTFNQLRDSGSVLLGTAAGEFDRDGDAADASLRGRQAFAALPGFIVHVLPRDTLDDINNQAENFVVYEVDASAADGLRRHGGFDHYNGQNRKLWTLSRSLPPRGVRGFERLLFERDANLRASLSARQRDVVERMDAILVDPFYRGFRIYVHPHAVKPVGFHIARLLDRNPRTPFRIELALHNVHTTLYRRYVQHLLITCQQQGEQPAANPAEG